MVRDAVRRLWACTKEKAALLLDAVLFWRVPEETEVGGRRLVLERKLADGGFSEVFQVRVKGGGGLLALKKIYIQSPEQLRDAQWEEEAHRRVGNSCPNCIALLGTRIFRAANSRRKRHDQFLFLFPLYRRGTLVDLLVSKGRQGQELPERVALELFAQICNGVRAFHDLDEPLAHRDIKPHNILLSDDDVPVLMDFGSAAVAKVDLSTRSERLALQDHASRTCSMGYRAPELWEPTNDPSRIVDERSDVWSLGCVLFAMLFGQGYSPFECRFLHNAQAGPFVRPAVDFNDEFAQIETAFPRECTFLSVIGTIPMPEKHSRSEEAVQLMTWILTVESVNRPRLNDVRERLEGMGLAQICVS